MYIVSWRDMGRLGFGSLIFKVWRNKYLSNFPIYTTVLIPLPPQIKKIHPYPSIHLSTHKPTSAPQFPDLFSPQNTPKTDSLTHSTSYPPTLPPTPTWPYLGDSERDEDAIMDSTPDISTCAPRKRFRRERAWSSDVTLASWSTAEGRKEGRKRSVRTTL